MKPLTADKIVGNWATVLLPICSDEAIDRQRLCDEIDAIVSCRPNGIYTGGTAGEFFALTEAEFDWVNQLVAERVDSDKIPFQIGASHTSAQVTLERVRRARQLHPAAIQVVLPDWFPLSNDEAIAFLSRVAEAADPVGLILYNPPHAKRVLEPHALAVIAKAIPSLVGIKVSGGDAEWYERMRPLCSRLSVFVAGHYLATGFARGAAGAYSNVACLHPLAAQRWYELMQSDIEAALVIERAILGFFDEYITPLIREKGYCNAAADKLLAAIGGWADVGARLRWPYRWLSTSTVERLRPIAHERLNAFFTLGACRG